MSNSWTNLPLSLFPLTPITLPSPPPLVFRSLYLRLILAQYLHNDYIYCPQRERERERERERVHIEIEKPAVV